MKATTNELGYVLKRMRGDIKQEHLAKKLGITQGYLSLLERGIKRPSIETLESYCTLFGKESIYRIIARGIRNG